MGTLKNRARPWVAAVGLASALGLADGIMTAADFGVVGTVRAQGYPARPVRLVVPYPPGGGTNIIGRYVGEKLSEGLGQPVVIDNRAGAGGVIGTESVAKAPADGYTLLIGTPGAITISPSFGPRPPYDSMRDFTAITLLATSPNLLVVHPSLPVRSVKELVALAKRRPGEINYATSGPGASPHLAAELFNQTAGVKLVHVPYKGVGPALIDLASGRVEVAFPVLGSALAFVKSGRLRAIAVTDAVRFDLLPDVPTMSEAGLTGYAVTNWYGLLAPAGVHADIVALLHRTAERALRAPDARTFLSGQGLVPRTTRPEETTRYLRDEIAKWAKVVKAAGLKSE